VDAKQRLAGVGQGCTNPMRDRRAALDAGLDLFLPFC
jgi:hypothetical protein